MFVFTDYSRLMDFNYYAQIRDHRAASGLVYHRDGSATIFMSKAGYEKAAQDTHFVVFMNAKDPKPTQSFRSRAALAPVFDDLNKYAATMHFVGQSTILTLSGDRATGEAQSTLAHHLTVAGTKRSLLIAALRYGDTFAKKDGAWLQV